MLTITLLLALALAALASLLAAVMSFGLHQSDAAGNGLGQIYVVIALGIGWVLLALSLPFVLLRAPHADLAGDLPWPWITLSTVVLAGLGLCAHLRALAFLFNRRRFGLRAALLRCSFAWVPGALALHAAWRLSAMPLPVQMPLWGCAGVVLGSAALAFTAPSQRRRDAGGYQPTIAAIAYPALLLQGRSAVRVLRQPADVRELPREALGNDALLIDAHAGSWRLDTTDTAVTDDGEARERLPLMHLAALPIAEVQVQLLAIERLHADPQQDRRVREQIVQQQDVTALSFVLPR